MSAADTHLRRAVRALAGLDAVTPDARERLFGRRYRPQPRRSSP